MSRCPVESTVHKFPVQMVYCAVLRESPWGTDGQTALAMLRSKQATRVGRGTHKRHGEAAN
jgi:hypothetical protein